MPIIRRAAPKDQESLQRLYIAVVSQAHWLPESSRQSTSLQSLTQGELIFVSCSEGDQILGFISIYEQASFIHHLYVSPESQGRGIGRELLQSLDTWLPKPWNLKCVTSNTKALRFYAAGGWAAICEAEGPDGKYSLLRKTSEA